MYNIDNIDNIYIIDNQPTLHFPSLFFLLLHQRILICINLSLTAQAWVNGCVQWQLGFSL